MENEQSTDLVSLEVGEFYASVLKWVNEATSKTGWSDWFSPITITSEKIIATDGIQLHYVDISALPSQPFPLGHWVVKVIRKDVVVLKRFNPPTIQEPDLDGAIERSLKATFELPKDEIGNNVWKLSFAMNASLLKKSLKIDWPVDYVDFEIIGQPVLTLHLSYGDMKNLQLRAIIAPLAAKKDDRCLPFGNEAIRLAPPDYSLKIDGYNGK